MNVDFGHCIWLMCDKDSELSKLTNGFHAHMTIKMNLEEGDSMIEFDELNCNITESIIVDIKPKKNMTYENGFNSLYYFIEYSNKNKHEKPLWWPDNAHISIRYKYDKDFTSSEKNLNLIDKTCEMRGLRLMKCTGHHSKWKRII